MRKIRFVKNMQCLNFNQKYEVFLTKNNTLIKYFQYLVVGFKE